MNIGVSTLATHRSDRYRDTLSIRSATTNHGKRRREQAATISVLRISGILGVFVAKTMVGMNFAGVRCDA